MLKNKKKITHEYLINIRFIFLYIMRGFYFKKLLTIKKMLLFKQ